MICYKLLRVLVILSIATICHTQGQSCTKDDIRLNTANDFFLSDSGAGRVEICYCTGGTCSWSTINGAAGSTWSWPNTLVACRQLGYSTSLNPIIGSSLPESGRADELITIYPFYLECDGTERTLSACSESALTTFSHEHDVHIQCYTSEIPTGRVRLTGSTISSMGVVEVYINRWVTICSSQWDDTDAGVVCRELGYEGGSTGTFRSFHGNAISTTPSLTGVRCGGPESTFASCSYVENSFCGSFSTLAGVDCQASGSPEGSVRLHMYNVRLTHQRVEVLYNGRWGAVCNVQWSVVDGEVVCRELGFDVSATDVTSSFTPFAGTGLLPIWVGQYDCSGDESELSSCATPYGIGYAPSCSRSTDAGLSCGEPVTNEGARGVLSGAAIAAIVTGSVVAVGVLSFMAVMAYLDKQRKRKGKMTALQRQQQQQRQQLIQQRQQLLRQQQLQQQQQQEQSAVDIPLEPVATDNVEERPDAELSAPAPPPYDAAKHAQPFAPPPQYSDKEKEAGLAYPGANDPDYPPPAPNAPVPVQPFTYDDYQAPTYPQQGYCPPGTTVPLPYPPN